MQFKRNEGVFPEVFLKAQDLILQDLPLATIQEKIEQYVTDVMFYKQIPPEINSRRYYPDIKKLHMIKKSVFKVYILQTSQIESLETHFKTLKEDFGAIISFKIDEPPKYQFASNTPKQQAQNKKSKKVLEKKKKLAQNGDSLKCGDQVDSNKPTYPGDCIGDSLSEVTSKNLVSTQKICLFYQSKCQQSLLSKYGSFVYISQVKPQKIGSRTIAVSLFLICVRTNVDYQVVGTILCNKYNDHKKVLKEALAEFKEINKFRKPKYLMIDPSEAISSVVEELFPGKFSFFKLSSKIFSETTSGFSFKVLAANIVLSCLRHQHQRK